MRKNLEIVTIGGGSGQFILLSALKEIKGINITAIVAMSDSGGSSGLLRDKLGVLPPGDILKCLIALSPYKEARAILQSRFPKGTLKGHNPGNMLLSQLSTFTNDFPLAVQAMGEILNIKGRVFPVTTDRNTLTAELSDGNRIFGESAIDVPRGQNRATIKNVFLVPHHCDEIQVYPPVLDAIRKANFILLGPGDLYTSIIPNLLVPKVADAIKESEAWLMYLVNIMTKYGETNDFKAIDFILKLEEKIGRSVDLAMLNNTKPSFDLLKKYEEELAFWVEVPENLDDFGNREIILDDMLESTEILRHSPEKLQKIFQKVFF